MWAMLQERGNKKYTIRTQIDDDGEEIQQPGDEDKFLVAHVGDHLMVPFQCETCHFRDIYKRDPVEKESDNEALDFIQDANIDAFWGREESTVASNL